MTEIKFIPAGHVSKHDMGEKVVAIRDLHSQAYANIKSQEVKKGAIGTLKGVIAFSPSLHPGIGELAVVKWENGDKNDVPLDGLRLKGAK